MSTRYMLFMAGAFLVLLGLGSFAMSRIGVGGRELSGSADLSPDGESGPSATSIEPLGPSPTYNVARRHGNGVRTVPGMEEVAARLNDESAGPQEDLEAVHELVQFHVSTFQTIPPGGENVDIMRSLTGWNAKKLAVFPPEHPALNERGELVDRWGTPYHFHPISRKVLEIRSAGPDGELWTDDDLMYGESEGNAGDS